MTSTSELPPNAIAVVGMAARLPGANTLSAFWDNLVRGEESIVTLSEDDLLAEGIPEKALANSAYVRRAALMDGIEEFDADFFGFTPQVARSTDPQHRLFLQTAFHAIEDAGYDPAEIEGTVGVYATSTTSGYLLHNIMSNYDPNVVMGQGITFDMVNLSMQNDKDYLATKVAYALNLRGPALSVQTACSSALVAVHLACQSILNGECEVALAGGASLRIPHHVGYWYAPGSMVSPTGHCRPFDARSDGTIFGSGVGVVVLKALQDAVDDGDRIHAVIRGSALNNDGSTKMTYAAPTAAGQADVIAEAHAIAEVDASEISYIETHGTGTPLGDPVEIEGLRQAFEVSEEPRQGPCYVGSVKSNIGHLESAAGIASLIKAILCLKHRAIPATLHYTSPNPELHLDRGPFKVRSEYGPWEWDGVLRAGVSSFGVGGTNAHVVLEEAPPVPVSTPKPGPQVLLMSARSPEALQQSRTALAAAISGSDALSLTDVAYTLGRRRKEKIRMAAVVNDEQHARTVLETAENDNVFIGEFAENKDNSDQVVFLFPGQGAQHIGMARGLYDGEPVFAEHFDQCAAGFNAELGVDLRAEIFEGTARNLERTDRTQPALFTVEYALAKLIESYGVRPAAMVGHSIGEYVAGTIAGVFDIETAIKVVSMRARLMHAAPRGVMVAVALGPDALAEHLTGDVDIAAINEPGGCVVAGSEESIKAFSDRLKQNGVVARRVRTSHAFHSRLMDSMIPEFTGFLSRQTLREPQIPLLSNVTGTWLAASEATNPSTWARQVRSTVRFSDEIDVLLGDPRRVLVEVGPGGTLTASATRHPKWSTEHHAVRLMRHHAQNRDDRDAFLLALGQLWAAGVDVDWAPLRGGQSGRLLTLPGYPFERQRHWIEHRQTTWTGDAAATNGAAAASTGGAEAAQASASGKSAMEATLQRIWGQCLGLPNVERNANFFELGGDSLVAISVAMNASNEGLDLTPQDLYENQTVAALAKALTARYAAGGLGRQAPGEVTHPPVPPNISYFLEHGVREHEQWRVPLILQLRPDVQVDDVCAVLTALRNHHEALRLRLVERAGTWEQNVSEPSEGEAFADLATRSLPEDIKPGTPQERDALLSTLIDVVRQQDPSNPLIATYVRGVPGGSCYLAISVRAIVADNASRDILLTDTFTAFGQQLAGEEIALQPVTTPWTEWSQRCAALAVHPAVVESRDYWLKTATAPTLRVAGEQTAGAPGLQDLARSALSLTVAETTEIDDARRRLRVPIDEMLLAALGRTIAHQFGDGTVAVDLSGEGRSVLKPDVDVRRTVGWFNTVYPVALSCTKQDGAKRLLDDVHDTLTAVPHYGIGYGLLRYLYAPTARQLGATGPADIFFSYIGTIPDLPPLGDDVAVRFDSDTALPVREAIAGLGHPIELRVFRTAGVLHLDWWYDSRRVDAATVQALASGFSQTLLELIREALAEDEMDSGSDELELVDLS
ncbi:phthiocerol type I polyketide synthase PpsE [Mycobacterium cookii]|uniref:Phthiocerol/phenolphthiocerol synthesis polyketide synthase type I PpsE n=2 Tax=Mycobacterium cookii TaxID=1775 RepID=A0A7I7KWT3_9MYCO|nr:type I polyketide synthase [Mycobacterium cookii]MCV7331459.1 acyltransferase domain-containing protein [Mycobacterium cookii]BBX45812.1 phthiocerol/phenolphthiocerol synthesis polyketide synthase type I PpsE [Mycobacterium cookii]